MARHHSINRNVNVAKNNGVITYKVNTFLLFHIADPLHLLNLKPATCLALNIASLLTLKVIKFLNRSLR